MDLLISLNSLLKSGKVIATVNNLLSAWAFLVSVLSKSLSSLINLRIVFNFQKEFKDVVCEAEDMDLNIYAALSNSNIKFMQYMREFLEQVEKETGIEMDEIRKMFSHSQLMKGFGMISNSSFLRIQDLVEDMLADDVLTLPPHSEFVIVIFFY